MKERRRKRKERKWNELGAPGGFEGEERFLSPGKAPHQQTDLLGQERASGAWRGGQWAVGGRQDRATATQRVWATARVPKPETRADRCGTLGAGTWGLERKPGRRSLLTVEMVAREELGQAAPGGRPGGHRREAALSSDMQTVDRLAALLLTRSRLLLRLPWSAWACSAGTGPMGSGWPSLSRSWLSVTSWAAAHPLCSCYSVLPAPDWPPPSSPSPWAPLLFQRISACEGAFQDAGISPAVWWPPSELCLSCFFSFVGVSVVHLWFSFPIRFDMAVCVYTSLW